MVSPPEATAMLEQIQLSINEMANQVRGAQEAEGDRLAPAGRPACRRQHCGSLLITMPNIPLSPILCYRNTCTQMWGIEWAESSQGSW